MTKWFFTTYCDVIGVSFKKAAKIIDGRYKPYLSALDDKYYGSNDIWEAKTLALQAYEKKYGIEATREKINELR